MSLPLYAMKCNPPKRITHTHKDEFASARKAKEPCVCSCAWWCTRDAYKQLPDFFIKATANFSNSFLMELRNGPMGVMAANRKYTMEYTRVNEGQKGAEGALMHTKHTGKLQLFHLLTINRKRPFR